MPSGFLKSAEGKVPVSAKHLHLTMRGIEWLSQFDTADRELAQRLLASLTLVSKSAFERPLELRIRDRAAETSEPVALFAAREVGRIGARSIFEESSDYAGRLSIDAVPRGADVGSEAYVAGLIRSIARTDKSKFLNHPSLVALKSKRCRKIIVVDDLIGSGKRVSDFLNALWRSRTIRSWWSRGFIEFEVIAYASTYEGRERIEGHKCSPSIKIERDCPTLDSLPISLESREQISDLCAKYGTRTSKSEMSLGYRQSAALLVFEHGCPNNVPAILWASQSAAKPWLPLFPSRSVLPAEKSAFPPEIARRDPVSVLIAAGQKHLAKSGGLVAPNPLGGDVLIALALIAKGVRRTDAISYATGHSKTECASLLENCVKWGLITITNRLTQMGLKEINAARRFKKRDLVVPERGEEDYYPKSLRSHIGG